MSKERKALDDFIKDYLFLCEKLCTNKQEKMLLDSNSPYNVLKTYLESIDNANPSELIKKLDNMYYCIDHQWLTNEQWEKVEKDYETIKQALLKAQEPKQYLKWEDLEFSYGTKTQKVRMVDTIYKIVYANYDNTKEVQLLSEDEKLLYISFVGKYKDNVQLFNDLHLERVEE